MGPSRYLLSLQQPLKITYITSMYIFILLECLQKAVSSLIAKQNRIKDLETNLSNIQTELGRVDGNLTEVKDKLKDLQNNGKENSNKMKMTSNSSSKTHGAVDPALKLLHGCLFRFLKTFVEVITFIQAVVLEF